MTCGIGRLVSHVLSFPPNCAGTRTRYSFVRFPPPQEAVQLLQGDQPPAQSTGHARSLHAASSVAPCENPHADALPPYAAAVSTV